jgi:hypothetical protein
MLQVTKQEERTSGLAKLCCGIQIYGRVELKAAAIVVERSFRV